MKKSEAIAEFLSQHAEPTLAELYDPGMEVQVMGPTPYRLDRLDRDTRQTWPINLAEAVGLTGWNFKEQATHWVGFDFDSVVGHVKGLTEEQLDEVIKAAQKVSWTTVYRSKSGRGIHIYVHLAMAVDTLNRKEHAALARAILSSLSVEVGLDLHSSVDKLGGVLWVWHRNATTSGFKLLKKGTTIPHVPTNWKDHVPVISGKQQRIKAPVSDPRFEQLVNKTRHVPLDQDHRLLLGWFAEKGGKWHWDSDRHMLVCHTHDLKRAHQDLELRGIFYTLATGKDWPRDQNCFGFPLNRGAWVIRRHGIGTSEHAAWSRDSAGWTRCYYNHVAELSAAAAAHSAVENTRGEFVFSTALKAFAALKDIEGPPLDLPNGLSSREATLAPHRKDPKRVVLTVERKATDSGLTGWLSNKKGDKWERVIDTVLEEVDVPDAPDDLVRHVCAGQSSNGWFVFSRDRWINVKRPDVVNVMQALGHQRRDIDVMLGQSVLSHWQLGNLPFQDEYPGNRVWNRDAARLAFKPEAGSHPTWDLVLDHCGRDLDALWPKGGADYLLSWIAALFQDPLEPLPYLFFWGGQESGKSTFHEALELLLKRGYVKADGALTNQGRFNGEIAGAVLCVVEETNLRAHRGAYDRIKEWVTARLISIQFKHGTPFDLPNSTHWVQCANHIDYCPVLPGDTRITMINVKPPAREIPKRELLVTLRNEAPAFLHAAMTHVLPEPTGRLRLPVLNTPDKEEMGEANRSDLEHFLKECTQAAAGYAVSVENMYDAFIKWIPQGQHRFWTRRRFTREMPRTILKGRYGSGGYIYYGNITLEKNPTEKRPLEVVNGRLVESLEA